MLRPREVLGGFYMVAKYSNFIKEQTKGEIDPEDWGYPPGTSLEEIERNMQLSCAEAWAKAAEKGGNNIRGRVV